MAGTAANLDCFTVPAFWEAVCQGSNRLTYNSRTAAFVFSRYGLPIWRLEFPMRGVWEALLLRSGWVDIDLPLLTYACCERAGHYGKLRVCLTTFVTPHCAFATCAFYPIIKTPLYPKRHHQDQSWILRLLISFKSAGWVTLFNLSLQTERTLKSLALLLLRKLSKHRQHFYGSLYKKPDYCQRGLTWSRMAGNHEFGMDWIWPFSWFPLDLHRHEIWRTTPNFLWIFSSATSRPFYLTSLPATICPKFRRWRQQTGLCLQWAVLHGMTCYLALTRLRFRLWTTPPTALGAATQSSLQGRALAGDHILRLSHVWRIT